MHTENQQWIKNATGIGQQMHIPWKVLSNLHIGTRFAISNIKIKMCVCMCVRVRVCVCVRVCLLFSGGPHRNVVANMYMDAVVTIRVGSTCTGPSQLWNNK